MNDDATLTRLLTERAASGAIALFDRDRAVTHSELLERSARLATGLRGLGVGPGDRVAVWLPNVTAWLECLFACGRLGAIALATNTRFRSAELADIVGRSGAKVLVTWPEFDRTDFAGVLAGCPAESLRGLGAIVAYDERPDPGAPGPLPGLPLALPVHRYADLLRLEPMAGDSAAPRAGCAIFTTSGTTKAPKFVLHDQRTLVSHAFDVVRAWGIDAESTMLLAPPLCGVFGVANAMAMLAAGRPFVMMPVWDAALAAAMIDAHRVTHFNASDDAIAQLLAQNDRTPAFPTVRFAGFAAFNPAQADIVERAQARGLLLMGLYGISEIQALFSKHRESDPIELRKPGGGFPVSPLARVRATDPVTRQVLPHGEAGELEFLAPSSRMVEYFGNPEATREAILDGGWYRSGDLGHTCADGRFVFLARLGDSLRLGGFLVSPQEIEESVQEVPGIFECQVVGVTTG
ncbi:MAG: hypothetical protein RIS35_3319, partial [Pseudomonadota bacterium]